MQNKMKNNTKINQIDIKSNISKKKFFNKLHKNKVVVLLAIFLVVLLWGANFAIVKVAMVEFSAYELLFSRLFLASIILLPFVARVQKEDFLYLVVCALLLVAGHFLFLFLAINATTNISAVSLVLQLSVPFSLILSWILLKDALSLQKIIGLIIAFGGIILLFYSPSMFDNLIPLLLAMFSAFTIGLYFIFVKKIKSLSSLGLIAYISLISLPMTYTFMLINGDSISHILSIELTNSWLAFLYAAIGGAILGHGIWAWLARHQEISFISPFLLLIPLVTVVVSWVLFDEVITIDFIITGTIVVFGLFFVFISKK
jgi:O-acetylserine/cysteine efflux transporter